MDLTGSNPRIAEVAPIDPMLSPTVLEVFAKAYLAEADPRSPTASPAFADLSGLPPLLIQAGTAEILIGEIEAFAKKAEASGVDVELEIWDDMEEKSDVITSTQMTKPTITSSSATSELTFASQADPTITESKSLKHMSR